MLSFAVALRDDFKRHAAQSLAFARMPRPQCEEAALSEDEAPIVEDKATNAEIIGLQQQLSAATAERDRARFEKEEIVNKANVIARERDDFRARAEAAALERDRLAAEVGDLTKRLEAALRKAEASETEAAQLRSVVAGTAQPDPAELLGRLARDKANAAVAWTRAKIPADSPALPWFDKSVEAITTLGCVAYKAGSAFIRWAVPQAIELTKRLAKEAEARLAKK